MSTAIIVYVVTHDSQSEEIARSDFPFRWARIIRIANNQYFETNAFSVILSKQAEWNDKYYVGLVQYSFFRKAMSGCNIQLVDENIPSYQKYDLIALSGRTYHDPDWYHANVLQKLQVLMQSLNMPEWFGRHNSVPQFFNNAFLCRPALMAEYCKWVMNAMNIVETTPALKQHLDQDSGYFKKHAPLEVQLASGKDYYDWRAFCFERLPCFWFTSKQCNIYFLNFPQYKVVTSFSKPRRVKHKHRHQRINPRSRRVVKKRYIRASVKRPRLRRRFFGYRTLF